jgi:hypothetical protein
MPLTSHKPQTTDKIVSTQLLDINRMGPRRTATHDVGSPSAHPLCTIQTVNPAAVSKCPPLQLYHICMMHELHNHDDNQFTRDTADLTELLQDAHIISIYVVFSLRLLYGNIRATSQLLSATTTARR